MSQHARENPYEVEIDQDEENDSSQEADVAAEEPAAEIRPALENHVEEINALRDAILASIDALGLRPGIGGLIGTELELIGDRDRELHALHVLDIAMMQDPWEVAVDQSAPELELMQDPWADPDGLRAREREPMPMQDPWPVLAYQRALRIEQDPPAVPIDQRPPERQRMQDPRVGFVNQGVIRLEQYPRGVFLNQGARDPPTIQMGITQENSPVGTPAPDNGLTSEHGTSPETARDAVCIICKEDKNRSDVLQALCQHHLCQDCFRTFVEVTIRNESLYPPKCCNVPIPLESGLHFLDSSLVELFKRKAAEFSTSDRTYCFQSACSAFIPPERIFFGVATCPDCRSETCSICKGLLHLGSPCSVSFDDQVMDALIETEKWARCPECKRTIELKEGCHHIT